MCGVGESSIEVGGGGGKVEEEPPPSAGGGAGLLGGWAFIASAGVRQFRGGACVGVEIAQGDQDVVGGGRAEEVG